MTVVVDPLIRNVKSKSLNADVVDTIVSRGRMIVVPAVAAIGAPVLGGRLSWLEWDVTEMLLAFRQR